MELFVELERLVSRRLSLAMVFEASTPRELACRIGSDSPASDWDNLVALKPGGTRPPLFVVSAGDGNLVGFAPLARHLSAEQPLYGLQPSGLDGHQPLDRGIEAMAERYLAKVREVQPHGPYLLAGRCNGASVAYEMAQRLRAAGESVPVLAGVDPDPPPAGPLEVAPGLPFDPQIESAVLRAEADGRPSPSVDDGAALRAWLREPVGHGVSRYLLETWHWRDDLRDNWPDPARSRRATPSPGGPGNTVSTRWVWPPTSCSRLRPTAVACPMAAPGTGPWTRHGRRSDRRTRTRSPSRFNPAFGPPLQEPVDGGAGMNRYLQAAVSRPDLASWLTDPPPAPTGALALEWAWASGAQGGA